MACELYSGEVKFYVSSFDVTLKRTWTFYIMIKITLRKKSVVIDLPISWEVFQEVLKVLAADELLLTLPKLVIVYVAARLAHITFST